MNASNFIIIIKVRACTISCSVQYRCN